MKRMVLFLLVFGLLSSMAYGGAIGGFGSYWSTEDADSGYGYGVRLASTADEAGYLEVRASRFEDLTDDEDGLDFDLEVTPLDLGMTLNMGTEDSVEFYIGGGGTYFLIDSEVREGSTRNVDIDDEWGWYGLVGLEIELSRRLTFFAEGTYRRVEGTMPGDGLQLC